MAIRLLVGVGNVPKLICNIIVEGLMFGMTALVFFLFFLDFEVQFFWTNGVVDMPCSPNLVNLSKLYFPLLAEEIPSFNGYHLQATCIHFVQ